jgi:hypothetical protein
MTDKFTLGQLQRIHVDMVASLIAFVYGAGYELSWGEAYRTQEQAQWDAQHGSGIFNSVHCDRLAVDLQLFKDGVYLTDPAAYKFMGDFWKTLHPLARWGGDFHTVDADHFSLEYEGRS